MQEIEKYIKNGFYPGFCGEEFGAGVDVVRLGLKNCDQRPGNVRKLRNYIDENFGRFFQDPRTTASIIAKMVNLGCISIAADENIVYNEDKLWDRG